jgi:NAD(P)-dependent dehydrogenase (short-subunit alcohol dehydrogenase family)
MSQKQLENTKVLLTGASQGIGRALALALAQAGAVVGLMARRETALEELAREIAGQGGRGLAFPGDISRPEAIHQVMAGVRRRLGSIQVLINCAGRQPPIGPFRDNDLADWEDTFRVNLFGPGRLIQAVLPEMLARRRGKIINFSGGGATGPRPHFSAYAASKAALVRLTETLALELEPYNIQVNAVAPGAVNTNMLEEILAAGEKAGPEYQQALERARVGGTPAALACELVVFLASPASGSLTGKLISAPHDPWRQWAGKDRELNATPLYTIRRLDPFTIKPVLQNLA